jgi:FlaA1/EpsC-like NDP-sugar epimerase
MKEFSNSILTLPRYSKRAIAIITDVGLCFICTWIAFVIRLEEIILLKDFNYYSAFISIMIIIPILWLFGSYRTIFRFAGLSILFNVLMSLSIYGFLYFLVIGVYGVEGVPRSIGVLQPILMFLAIMSTRLGVKYLLVGNIRNNINKKNILVYGAGDAGRQLVFALENNPEFKVLGFLDDNEQLHGQAILGKTVYSKSNLEKLIEARNITFIFLAMPTISRKKRNHIIEMLNQYKLVVKTLPSISEILNGKITMSDIRDLNIEDLLNRDPVRPDTKLLNKNINSKTILVTGAGGSIGSELCRQIVKLKPKKLILLELNEYSLYKIYEELQILNKKIDIISLLVNAQDQRKLERIFDLFKVDTVYHTAAYKHVPLVEENICEGVKNNVFSTLALAKASVLKEVSNLVLISSDKAVRPTNIMGASKRLSELCMQGIYNQNKEIKTNFSIVRFGNVLESSGSVIPKFKKQIKSGGPVTLTHPEVTRYFMTVSEAAQLVMQAGAMGKKSEVFVLDMGKKIKIKDLIHKMINLSGFSIKNENNSSGDIEIKVTGLRPGEKLYEELLLGHNPEKTIHNKIYKAHDPFIPFDLLKRDLDKLSVMLEENKVIEVVNMLMKLIPLYHEKSKIVDFFYREQLNIENYRKRVPAKRS